MSKWYYTTEYGSTNPEYVIADNCITTPGVPYVSFVRSDGSLVLKVHQDHVRELWFEGEE